MGSNAGACRKRLRFGIYPFARTRFAALPVCEDNFAGANHAQLFPGNTLNIGIAADNLLQFAHLGQLGSRFLELASQRFPARLDPGQLLLLLEINRDRRRQHNDQQHPDQDPEKDFAVVDGSIRLSPNGFHAVFHLSPGQWLSQMKIISSPFRPAVFIVKNSPNEYNGSKSPGATGDSI